MSVRESRPDHFKNKVSEPHAMTSADLLFFPIITIIHSISAFVKQGIHPIAQRPDSLSTQRNASIAALQSVIHHFKNDNVHLAGMD